MAQADDDELMARVQRRDQAAFSCLVSRHLNAVHRYLLRLTGSRADADELSQEAFLRLWQRADRYRPGKVKLTTWLHRVAHNLAVDALRRRPPQAGDAAALDAGADEASDPERLASSRQTGQRLDAAISALPPNQRAALLLCQVQGFSNREAAGILGVTVRGLESLLARARRSVREAVLEHQQPEQRRQGVGS